MQRRLEELSDLAELGNTVHAMNLNSWSKQQIEEFEREKILLFRGYSEQAICGGCYKKCFVEPKIVRYPDGTSKGVILCTDDEYYGRIDFDMDELRYWDINIDKLPNTNKKKKKVKRSRATQKQLEDRNRAVAMAAAKFKSEHDRLPTVTDIVTVTSYGRQQIYSTDAYKEGKVIKAGSKATGELTGSSVTETEYFGGKSINHSRIKRRSNFEQAHLDALIEQQAQDDKSNFVR